MRKEDYLNINVMIDLHVDQKINLMNLYDIYNKIFKDIIMYNIKWIVNILMKKSIV